VGAIFGQTEGLLGEDMDLRDLQRSGRVGRIDVTLTSKHGKTAGDLYIASSLDRAETAILAAALETIERIGPCVSRISVEGIEDLRAIKRRKIVDRAKELLMESFDEVGLSTNEILAEVREASRVVKITAIGDDRLPAGPTVLESDAIIILEGRADVLNLLRCGIKNTVAVEGTKVPEIVAELSRKKNTTVFVDGDRGGDLILKELLQVADVDFVAFSPRGRSVEDMTRKEIIKSLRNKVPADVVRAQVARNEPLSDLVFEITAPEDEAEPESRASPAVQEAEVLAAEEKPEPREAISSVEGHADYMKVTGRARVLNSDAVILGDYTIKELEDILPKLDSDAAGIIMDASCGQKLVDSAYKKGLKYIAAREFTGIVHRPAGIRLIPL
ncbi:MAG TPA: DNA primase DnaG, partial [Methanocorpusculum sp.]|nr:DNA primase DnaG [Methanocorpusculum sp.]